MEPGTVPRVHPVGDDVGGLAGTRELGDGRDLRSVGPDRQVQDAELMESLRAAITKLPGQQGEVFCLRHLNGLSYEEIAEEMGMSVDGVGVSLHRAKARLRELLVSACAGERASE